MSNFNEEIDDPRRQFLLQLLATGAFTNLASTGFLSSAFAEPLSGLPRPVPAGKSIYDMKGLVKVNGRVATMDTFISANDTIETGDKSYLIFVVGKDAFILRSNSRLDLSSGKEEKIEKDLTSALVNSLRLVTGKLLSVFGKSSHEIITPSATIGIRGTGVYTEANPDETYFCTCYGTTVINANSDPSVSETIISVQHDAPKYISSKASNGQFIRPAPFKNHEDIELLLIEELVGRQTPFPVVGGARRTSINPY